MAEIDSLEGFSSLVNGAAAGRGVAQSSDAGIVPELIVESPEVVEIERETDVCGLHVFAKSAGATDLNQLRN
jgi:hypothetical protein